MSSKTLKDHIAKTPTVDTNVFLDKGEFPSVWFKSLSPDDQWAHQLHYWNHVGACFKAPPFPNARIQMLGDDTDIDWSRIYMASAVRVHARHADAFKKCKDDPGDAFKTVDELLADIKKHQKTVK